MEGATGQEHQCGCVQPHPSGACCGASPLLPADPSWRAQTDQVGHKWGLINIFYLLLKPTSSHSTKPTGCSLSCIIIMESLSEQI